MYCGWAKTNSSQLEKDYLNNTIKAHSHRAKVNTKVKEIKEQSEEITKKIQTSKIRFLIRFPSAWIGPKNEHGKYFRFCLFIFTGW